MRSISLFSPLFAAVLISCLVGNVSAYPVPSGCDHPSYQCIEKGGTKIIDGIPVTLDCWRYHVKYTCGITPNNTCKTYEQNCKIGPLAKCVSQIQGLCVEYRYTYECPTKHCANRSLYCTQNVFCIDGDCTKTTPTKNDDFGKDAAELAAAAKAAEDAAKQKQSGGEIRLFSGHKEECSYTVAGINNCCDPKGWLHGILGCSDKQKKLAADYKHYLVTYIGEYCHNKVAGACITKHKVYCVFDSKMARIIQDYGRDQIGKSYGHDSDADCSGYTIDQFQKLNFNVMDFVNPRYMYRDGKPNKAAGIAGDMHENNPNAKAWSDAINRRIHEDIDNKTPSSDKANAAKASQETALLHAIKKQRGGQ